LTEECFREKLRALVQGVGSVQGIRYTGEDAGCKV
jgi:hypothetical protein